MNPDLTMPVIDPSDRGRCRWVAATAVISGAGLAATAMPFVASLSPGERARAQGAPVEFDLKAMQIAELKTIEWRGKPVPRGRAASIAFATLRSSTSPAVCSRTSPRPRT